MIAFHWPSTLTWAGDPALSAIICELQFSQACAKMPSFFRNVISVGIRHELREQRDCMMALSLYSKKYFKRFYLSKNNIHHSES